MGRKKSGIIGLVLALIYIFYNISISIRISSGFPIEELFSELSIVALIGFIIVLPALLLIFIKSFKRNINWIGWLYVTTLVLGFIFYIYSNIVINDPLAVGLPMLLIEIPLLVVISALLFVYKNGN